MGRRRKLETGEDLILQIGNFIEFVESDDSIIPTDFRLCRFLGVSTQAIGKMDGFEEAMELLEAFREDWFLRRIEENPKLAGFYLGRLKSGSGAKGALTVTLRGADEPFD